MGWVLAGVILDTIPNNQQRNTSPDNQGKGISGSLKSYNVFRGGSIIETPHLLRVTQKTCTFLIPTHIFKFFQRMLPDLKELINYLKIHKNIKRKAKTEVKKKWVMYLRSIKCHSKYFCYILHNDEINRKYAGKLVFGLLLLYAKKSLDKLCNEWQRKWKMKDRESQKGEESERGRELEHYLHAIFILLHMYCLINLQSIIKFL